MLKLPAAEEGCEQMWHLQLFPRMLIMQMESLMRALKKAPLDSGSWHCTIKLHLGPGSLPATLTTRTLPGLCRVCAMVRACSSPQGGRYWELQHRDRQSPGLQGQLPQEMESLFQQCSRTTSHSVLTLDSVLRAPNSMLFPVLCSGLSHSFEL